MHPPEIPQKPNLIGILNACGLGMQIVLYELEMQCTEILQLYHVAGLKILVKRHINAHG